jgi:hypothetical protein
MTDDRLANEALQNEIVPHQAMHLQHPQVQFSVRSSHDVVTKLYEYIKRGCERIVIDDVIERGGAR